ncbi:NosD domain-containing protein [Methanosarcina sp. MTP4]|uniref:NosD domain-containing protein n=1 Tax=Methanosarcina sp. MTP4 TaxID=1434100 RepID=UPI0018CFEBD7|nr:NosD domain-containing protein [Methanosarcina sp. MTP4]
MLQNTEKMNRIFVKFTISIALFVSLVIFVSLLFEGTCSASVLNVMGDGEAPANYTSIGDALDNSGDGDIILVYGGVYVENLRVSTSNLTLAVPSNESAVIRAQDPESPVISVNADNVTIVRFSVNGTDGWGVGIFLEDGKGLRLVNNSIEASYQGVSLEKGENCRLENNSISGADSGIFLKASSNNTLIGNTIQDCFEGLLLKNGCTGNSLLENRLSGNFRAVYLENFCRENRIESNAVLNNSFGICLEDSCSTNSLESNEVLGSQYGIFLDNSCNGNNLGRNNASENRYAFYLKASCESNSLYNNTADDSLYGIYLGYSCSGNTLSGNTIASDSLSSGLRGICLETACGNNTLEENIIEGQGFEGICLENCSDNLLAGNNASENSAGVKLKDSCSNNTLENNILFNNSLLGLALEDSENNRVCNNSVLNNSGGLYLRFSPHNLLTGNRVSFNGNGIFFTASDENVLNDSYVLRNSLFGLALEDSENNTVYNNFFDNEHNAVDDCKNNIWNVSVSQGPNIYNGHEIGGNYWSDYPGEDMDLDGFGDTPYDISDNISDYLPLVQDITPPVIILKSPENMTYRMLPVPVSAKANEAISEWWYTLNGSGPGEFSQSDATNAKAHLNVANGTYTFRVSGTDLSGNLNSTAVDFNVEIDPSPSDEDLPLISINSPEDRFYSDSRVELDVSASGTLLYWEYTLDDSEYCDFEESNESGAFSILNVSDGQHEVLVFGVNDKGYSNSTSRNFTVDTIPPALTVKNPLNSSTVYNSSVLLLVEASENISVWNYTLDGAELLSFNETYDVRAETPLLNVPEGLHTVNVSARDLAGNYNSNVVYFSVNDSGDLWPEISIISPVNNKAYNKSSIEFRVFANEDLSAWWYTLDDSSFLSFPEWNESAASSLLEVEPGNHCVKAYGRDSGNNTNSTSVSFSVDTKSPLITVNSPVNGTQYTTESSDVNQSIIDLNVTINEPGSIWYRVDDAVPSTPVNGTELKGSLDLDVGSHNITFFAKDPAGNRNFTESYVEVSRKASSGSDSDSGFEPGPDSGSRDGGLPAYYKLKMLRENAQKLLSEQFEPSEMSGELLPVTRNSSAQSTNEASPEEGGFFSWLKSHAVPYSAGMLLLIFFMRFLLYVLKDIDD